METSGLQNAENQAEKVVMKARSPTRLKRPSSRRRVLTSGLGKIPGPGSAARVQGESGLGLVECKLYNESAHGTLPSR